MWHTGSVIEFRNEDIEKLQRRVAEELGFELIDHRLELYGVPKGRKPNSVMRRPSDGPAARRSADHGLSASSRLLCMPVQWLLLKLNSRARAHLSPPLSPLCRRPVRHPISA